jgi:hypothetical protein
VAGRKQKSNGPLKKIKSTLDDDWKSIKQSADSYQSQRKVGTSVADSAIKAGDELLENLSKTADGGSNKWKGGAKVGGMALGGMALLDWLFD